MSWTGRSDQSPCCTGSRGAVQATERVARLTLKRTLPPEFVPFSRSELYPPKKGSFSNECGKSTGVSVVRCDGLTNEQLAGRSDALAALRPNRKGDGAIVAVVKDIRNVRSPSAYDMQAILVYDDPLPKDSRHAILRGNELTPPEERALVLLDLSRSFK